MLTTIHIETNKMDIRIDYIIARILSGESSAEDIFYLSEWLNENEKHKEEFCRLKGYWDAEVTFNHSIFPSLSAEKLQREINIRTIRQKKKRLWRQILSFAAAAVFLLLLTVSYFHYTDKSVSTYYTYLTDEQKSAFLLDDGTRITLNKNSRLTYSDDFGKEKRSVRLQGEAYFEVAKDSLKPFRVEMDGASITVLGTHFSVKAAKGTDEITATLVEGSIRFDGAKQHITMLPNQQLTFKRSTNLIDIKQIDTEITTAWKDGLLKYKSVPFTRLMCELEQAYQVTIRIENKKLMNESVTVSGTFSKEQSMEQILKVIARSLPIRWSNSNGVYTIK